MGKLVALLKRSFEDDNRPLKTSLLVKIVRKIYNENGKSLSDVKRKFPLSKDFVARAKEIFDNDEIESDYVCPHCFKRFMNRKNRDRHVESLHDRKESGEFKCLSCAKTFMCATSLRYHTDTAHAEVTTSEVKCNICNLKFRHKQILKRHKLTVHKKGFKKCEECGKYFTRTDSLTKHKATVHKRAHFAFGQAERMSVHKDGFKCKLCGKDFFGEEASIDFSHHVAEKCKSVKMVECEECGAPFTHQQDLRKHMSIKHKSDPSLFSCTLCDFTSNYSSNLNKHKKRRHGDR